MTPIPTTGVENAVAKMIASAKAEADAFKGYQKWVVLSLYAEIHSRTAAAIQKLANEQARVAVEQAVSTQ